LKGVLAKSKGARTALFAFRKSQNYTPLGKGKAQGILAIREICFQLHPSFLFQTQIKPGKVHMPRNRIQLIATMLATALLAQVAVAQTSDSKNQLSAARTSGIHINKLIGAEVKSSAGENYGKVEDVIMDPQTGKATFAIIGKGGVLKLGEKRLPVPWQALTINSEKQVTLNMDAQNLGAAPTVQSSASTELDNTEFVVSLYKYYDIATPGSGAAVETPGGAQSGSSSNAQTNSSSSKP
jgi:sporulation protein YlmC with PRC-barrel domain